MRCHILLVAWVKFSDFFAISLNSAKLVNAHVNNSDLKVVAFQFNLLDNSGT